jgi:uncharacterized protein (TIGR02246 family)
MKKLSVIVLLFTAMLCNGQNDETEIGSLLTRQTQAWNAGNIDGFMQTYWQSDSLMFVGKEGVTWGWKNTLEHYKKSYPGKAAMGELTFDIIKLKRLSDQYYFVVGKWMLKRTAGNLSGHYNLLIQKINGEWKIIADHSS